MILMEYPNETASYGGSGGFRARRKSIFIGALFAALLAFYFLGGRGGGTGQQVREISPPAPNRTDFTALATGKTTVSGQPTNLPSSYSMDDPTFGPADAQVTIVEFSDFECPFCRQEYPVVKELLAKYPREVRFQYRDFPITDAHPHAFAAAEAAECAGVQGKYWEYHDLLFEHQGNLAREDLAQYAIAARLDLARFNACLDGRVKSAEVEDDLNAGVTLGVGGTPTFFINGMKYEGVLSLEELEGIVGGLLR